MIRITQLKLRPDEPIEKLHALAEKRLGVPDLMFELVIRKMSVDARKKPDIFYVYTVDIILADERTQARILKKNKDRSISLAEEVKYAFDSDLTLSGANTGSYFNAEQFRWYQPGLVCMGGQNPDRPVIVGTGPAGLFCGLLLAREGLRPILLERGLSVKMRTEKVHAFWDGSGKLDPDCNVQFGEGGAGTFSDGKLNTGVKDQSGRIRFILEEFVKAGADESILYSAKPHIGTDVLAKVVAHLRDEILARGGEVRFHTCMDSLTSDKDHTWTVGTRDTLICGPQRRNEDNTIVTKHLVLAIGHSARDTFELLKKNGFRMTAKAFAVGVRIQHPQGMIDDAMYGENCPYEMPPASYKLTHRLSDGHGVYSFCMCPGGYVVNASSEEGRLAVNGMSYQTRDSENANSAIVVTVSPEDILKNLEPEKCKGTFSPDDPLIGMYFQRTLEEKAFLEGGGTIPVQRFEDFCKNRPSEQSGSIAPQIRGAFSFANVRRILPEETACGIEEGIFAWERQVSGFSCGDALLAGIESRTSSPVRIERGEDYQAEGYKGVYPCGEGAGYAGGITSAAVDGLKVAEAILSASEKDSLSQSAGRTAGLSGEPAGEQAGTSVQD